MEIVVTEIRCMTTKNEQFSEDGIWKNTQKNKRKNATIDSALVDDDEQENFLESLTDPKMRSRIVPLHV
jgi:hypothetical protein